MKRLNIEQFDNESDNFWNTAINGGVIKEDICIPNYFTKLLFSVIFPPLGVGMDEHEKGYPNVSRIFIAFVLTMLFYFPGLIYAMTTNSYS